MITPSAVTLSFAILTPVYNGSRYLPELIESVRVQDYSHFEHIIINDGSNDGGATVHVLERYPHLHWKSQRNVGEYATFNKLLTETDADIVTFICADDLYPTNTVLSNVARHFLSNPELDAVIGKTGRLAQTDGGWYVFYPDLPACLSKRLIRYSVGLQHCSIFVRRRLIERKGLYFDHSFKMCGDWDWIIRLLAATRNIMFVNDVCAYWRLHRNQTSRVGQTGLSEARRVCDSYGTNFRLHRAIHSATNYIGMMSAAYALGRQKGISALMRVVGTHVRRTIAGIVHPEN